MRFLLITRSYADSKRVQKTVDWEKLGHKLCTELNPLSGPEKIRLIRPDAIILFGSLGGADTLFFVGNLLSMKMPMSIIVLPNNQQWREEVHHETETVAGLIKIYYLKQLNERNLLDAIGKIRIQNNSRIAVKHQPLSNGSFKYDSGCLSLISKNGNKWSYNDMPSFFISAVNSKELEIVEDSPEYGVILSTYEIAQKVKDLLQEQHTNRIYCTADIECKLFSDAYERLLFLNRKRYFLNKDRLYDIDINVPAAVIAFPNEYIRKLKEFSYAVLNSENNKAINELKSFLTFIVQPTMNFSIVRITGVILKMLFLSIGGKETTFFQIDKDEGKYGRDAEAVTDAFSSLLETKKYTTLSPEVVAAADYIESHYSQQIMVNDIAAYVGVSLSNLSKKFKTQFGCSLIGYLTIVRVLISSLEIAQFEESIAEIAVKNGFTDTKYFSRAFKKTMGGSPSDFREV